MNVKIGNEAMQFFFSWNTVFVSNFWYSVITGDIIVFDVINISVIVINSITATSNVDVINQVS